MRTTLTLDEDVVRLLSDEAHRTQRPFKQVVNDAIRRALVKKRAGRPAPRYRVVVHDSGRLMPGIDPGRLNQLVDELEIETFIEKHAPAASAARAKGSRR